MRPYAKCMGLVVLALSLTVVESTGRAQSYVPPPNTIGAQFSFNNNFTKGFYSFCGDEYGRCLDDFTYKLYIFTIGAEYSTPIEGLAISAQLPMIDTNETGAATDVPDVADEGYQVTDLRTDVRYALPQQPAQFRIAPQIGFTYPVGDYPVPFAFHGAYGRKLWELHLGLNVGHNITESSFVDFNYTYTISEIPTEHPYDDPTLPTLEEVGVKRPNRSDGSLTVGYFPLPALLVQASGVARWTHGGFNWTEYASWDIDFLNWTPEQISKDAFHDRVPKEKFFLLRGGLSYQILEELAVFTDVYRLMKGGSVVGLWGFGIGISGSYTL
jgi:hypothetical protein